MRYGSLLTKLWTSIYQLRTKYGKIKALKPFYEHIASIFTLKFEKFLWRIWKIKPSDSSLNLCPLNELGQVTTMEATKINQKPIIIDWVLKNGGISGLYLIELHFFRIFTTPQILKRWKKNCEIVFCEISVAYYLVTWLQEVM